MRVWPAAPKAATELTLLMLTAWALLVAVPLLLGGLGLGWDALNHHIYLGWIGDGARFGHDFMAAAYQSFQYPYLYWPVYKLYEFRAPGPLAGAILASFNLVVVPALWLVGLRMVDERTWYGTAMRVIGVVLAFAWGVVLSHLDSTANDLLAAIPLVWAIALALAWPASRPRWASGASGLLAGAAVAFKLSNGPLVLVMPLLWMAGAAGWRRRLLHMAIAGTATILGFLMLYGHWGWQLWVHYGNPVYPFADGWFAKLRDAMGHHP